MMRRYPALALAVALLSGYACQREDRDYRAEPVRGRGEPEIVVSGLYAGPSPPSAGAGVIDLSDNAYHVSEGKRLFRAMNCNGCHANGGGDIGPPLMDDSWIYGSEPGNIYATIVEGRPNGMPSFRQKLPEQQVWQLVAYVRALGGFVRKDIAPGRSDDLSARPSEQSLPEQPVSSGSGTLPAVQGTGQ
jgi:cytochrome c oxidase cbb3-type subunit 3